MKTIPAIVGTHLLAVLPASAQSVWAESDVHTFRFGVEQDFAASTRIDNRHSDLFFRFCGGGGSVSVQADAPPAATNAPPMQAHLHANSLCRLTMPPALAADYAFTGVAANETFWLLPQNQEAGKLFLGIESQSFPARLEPWNPNQPAKQATSTARWLRIRLVAMRGPAGGHFSLFQYGVTVPVVYMSTASGGIDINDSVFVTSGSHDHYNWSFSQPGLYELDFRVASQVLPAAQVVTLDEPEPLPAATRLRWSAPEECCRYTLERASSLAAPVVWNEVPGAVNLPYTAQPLEALDDPPPSFGPPAFYRVRAHP